MATRRQKLVTALLGVVFALSIVPVGWGVAAPAAELFLSEYVEGSSFNKALEIYNGTGAAVDLAAGGYAVEVYFNGSASAGLTIALTGTLADGDAYVVTNQAADAAILSVADQVVAVTSWFNGDDAVVLRKGASVVDVIGQIGFDPGSEWGTALVGTQNNTLRRLGTVCAGDPDGSDPFDPSTEWAGFAQDSFGGLGAHLADCAAPPPEACGDPHTPIHDVQGAGSASPIVGDEVAIEGVVVGDFQPEPGVDDFLGGFHVQTPDLAADGDPATSEGIFVFAPAAPEVDVGDAVRVRGVVAEFRGLTDITNVVQVWICSTGHTVAPTPLSLPLASLDQFEQVEGMLVTIPQPLVISEYFNFDRFGEIVLTSQHQHQPTALFDPGSPEAAALASANARGRITLDDGRTSQNPDPALHPNGLVFDLANRFRGGDTVSGVTGAMDYAFGQYRIQPTQGAGYAEANPRPPGPDDVGGSVKVASFNVLNYFTTLNSRGADTPEEFERQRTKIIAALAEIDADVVGLAEIENNLEAIVDLVDGLNASVGAGSYAHVDTGVIGADQIRVAFIYQPASISAVGDYAILDSSVDPTFLDMKNRPVLAQTFLVKGSGGVFTAAVNHLKSKGSSCDDVGDPDLGDGAGNCNLTRKAAAEALGDWLASDPTGTGSGNFLILGDLNSYDKEDPIDALLAAGYTDLLAAYGGEEAYTFVFDGQLGYLDYALASAGLVDAVTGTTVWHINADEPDILNYDTSFKQPPQQALYEPNAFRSSDHDPLIVGLELCDAIAPTIEISGTPDMLWPANHKYVEVTATVTASDGVGPAPTVTLLSVTSNEPDNGADDGNTVDDIEIVDDTTFMLRAERSGAGSGRIYTITYLATDACGNTATASATVTVPLSQGS